MSGDPAKIPVSELLPEHWLSAQRLMVGLSLIQHAGASTAGDTYLANTTLDLLQAPPELLDGVAETPDIQLRYQRRLECLHPATVRRLADFPPELLGQPWANHRALWRHSYKQLWSDGKMNPIAGSKLIANRILNNDLKAAQIISVAKHELSSDWPENHDVVRSMRDLLNELRDPTTTVYDRLNALKDFREKNALTRWEMVENAILQQWFSWPLIVTEGRSDPVAWSLPMLVNVDFLGSDGDPFIGDGLLASGGWRKSLKKATYAARELWLNKHSSWHPDFLEDIRKLTATLDVRVAEAVIDPFLHWASFDLTDNSAEAYLALTILGKIVNPGAIENVCATGNLGEYINDREGGGDHYIEEPGYVSVKFAYALNSYLFDSMILPWPAEGIESVGHLTVRKASKLSEYASAVFGQKWRKMQFVRAPDLAIFYKPEDKAARYGGPNPPIDEEVEEILEILRKNHKSPVLHLEGYKPRKVAQALYRVSDLAQSRAKKFNLSKERVGSYSFVRAVADEINERFWKTVWELINGSAESFYEFQFVASARKAANILANELNNVRIDAEERSILRPNKDDPTRAPDVLVIAYTYPIGHYFSTSLIKDGPFSRLSLQNLESHLNGSLNRTYVPDLHWFLGCTRLILVRDDIGLRDYTVSVPKQDLEVFDSELQDAIETLSVFRFGFTREMAGRLLKVSNTECMRVLTELKNIKFKSRQVVEDAESAGEYLLRVRVMADDNSKKTSDLHFGAANAIAGFLDPEEGMQRLNFGEALSPHSLHEAQWHLRKAGALNRSNQKATRAHDRLSRLFELFGWTRLRWATQASKMDSIELLNALIEHNQDVRRRGFFKYSHPIEHLLAAKYASKMGLEEEIYPAHRKRCLKLRDEYLRQAFSRISDDTSMEEQEKNACLYIFATSKACLLFDENSNTLGLQNAESEIDLAMEHARHESELMDHRWLEYMGDRETDHLHALEWYKRGVVNPDIPNLVPRVSLAVKYLGAAALAGVSLSEKAKSAVSLRHRRSNGFASRSPKGGFSTFRQVKARWNLGHRAFVDRKYDF